jgi:putative ABC transport system permease protein
MFDAPFLHGGGWSKDDEQREARVAVITRELAERVFKKTDVVGQRIRFDDEDFTITGVLDRWELRPRFYDVTNNTLDDSEDVFLPFSVATAKEMSINGSIPHSLLRFCYLSSFQVTFFRRSVPLISCGRHHLVRFS